MLCIRIRCITGNDCVPVSQSDNMKECRNPPRFCFAKPRRTKERNKTENTSKSALLGAFCVLVCSSIDKHKNYCYHVGAILNGSIFVPFLESIMICPNRHHPDSRNNDGASLANILRVQDLIRREVYNFPHNRDPVMDKCIGRVALVLERGDIDDQGSQAA